MHTREIKVHFKADLYAVDLNDDTVFVLQLCHLWAADECEPRARRSVGTGNIRRASQIVCDALNFPASEPKHADPDAADADRIHLAGASQGAFAAARANDHSPRNDAEMNCAVLQCTLSRPRPLPRPHLRASG